MNVIKDGVLKSDKLLEGECKSCRCLLEAQANECFLDDVCVPSGGMRVCFGIKCPQCSRTIHMSLPEVISAKKGWFS